MISVIIRTFNNEKFIKKTVESALNQNFENYEIIIVNDGSTDNTKSIIESFDDNKIRVINQKNQGMIEAGYAGLNNAKGEYIIFLDGDDELEKTALSELFNAIKCYDFAYSQYYEVDGATKKIVSINNMFDSIACGTLFKKSCIDKIGFWDRNLIFPEYDLLIRLKRHDYNGVYVKKPLYIYNRHKDSFTSNKEKVTQGKKEIVDKYGAEFE